MKEDSLKIFHFLKQEQFKHFIFHKRK